MLADKVSADWVELSLLAEGHSVDALEEALLAIGAIAVTLDTGDGSDVVEPLPGEMPLWPCTRVTGLFAGQQSVLALEAQLQRRFSQPIRCASRTMANEDWTQRWLVDYHPMEFGNRLWICPSSIPAPNPQAPTVILDPGLAFGTGTHPTTALCLEWLATASLTGRRIIDYGCGSGILGIAALKLGAAEVTAVDIDPQAIIATEANAERNHVAAALSASLPPASLAPADIVLANIVTGPLLDLVAHFAELVKSGGSIVLSGLLERQLNDIFLAYAPWFELQERRQREGWLLVEARRR